MGGVRGGVGKPCELYCGGECVLVMFSQVMWDMLQVGAVDIPAIQWPPLSLSRVCVCVCVRVCVHIQCLQSVC